MTKKKPKLRNPTGLPANEQWKMEGDQELIDSGKLTKYEQEWLKAFNETLSGGNPETLYGFPEERKQITANRYANASDIFTVARKSFVSLETYDAGLVRAKPVLNNNEQHKSLVASKVKCDLSSVQESNVNAKEDEIIALLDSAHFHPKIIEQHKSKKELARERKARIEKRKNTNR